jgi:hypothetical protein
MPSHGNPGPSQKFQIAFRIRLLTLSGSKRKGAQINLIRDAQFPEPSNCLLKVPENEPPPLPNGDPMESHPFPELSCTCFSNSSIKVLLTKQNKTKKKNHPSLKGPKIGVSHIFPKMVPLWKQTPISRALLGISFGVPSKGALPLGSPHTAPIERDTPFPEPSFIHQSPWQISPLQVAQLGPY